MAQEVQIAPGVMKLLQSPAPQGARSVQRGNKVTVNCTGYLKDGMKKFWSTLDPGSEPFSFQVGVGQVIQGWDDGCMSMKLGEKARYTLSADKAYGKGGFPAWGIPPNAPLVFEIEMLAIQ